MKPETAPTIRRPETILSDATKYRFRFDHVTYDEGDSTLRVEGEPVQVEPKPLILLATLLRHPNEVLTREQLFEHVWKGRPTVAHVLGNAINKLRTALGSEGGRRIVTVPRIGYRFHGPLERVVVGRHRPATPDFAPGVAVPGRSSFRLERELNPQKIRSGIRVWLARHARLGDLRIFKFASDADDVAALKREYTIYRVLHAALPNHDGFAQVLDGNFADKPFFLECAYGGVDLSRWASEEGGLATLSTVDRVALFLKIAGAVEAAHGVGVLHKDLKPSNVLIQRIAGTEWNIQLTDFGNSRLLEPERLAALGVTALGLTVTQAIPPGAESGTLLYLAPEVLTGQSPTTQSDLYALGLILYQLLAGDLRRPLATGWQRDIHDDLLRDDIVAATEGDPANRLKSVSALVERLQSVETRRADHAKERITARALADASVELERARARRPWVVAAFVLLVAGLTAGLWSSERARRAGRVANAASLATQRINDFLNQDVLGSADLSRAHGGDVTMATVLARAAENVATRFADEPRVEASVRRQLAEIYETMSRHRDAELQLRSAIARVSAIDAPDTTEVLLSRFALARILAEMQEKVEAKTLLEAAEHDAGAAALAAQTEIALAATRARYALSIAVQKYPEALVAAQRMKVLVDQLAPSDLHRRAEAGLELANAQWRLSRFADMKQTLETQLEAPFEAGTAGAVTFARTRAAYANLRFTLGETDRVEQELISARDVLIAYLGTDDDSVIDADYNLGRLYDSLHEMSKRIEALRRVQRAYLAKYGEESERTQRAAIPLLIAEAGDRPEVALRGLLAKRAWFVAHTGAQSPISDWLGMACGERLSDLGRYADALALFDGIDKPHSALEASPWPDLGGIELEHGRAALGAGQRERGLALIREGFRKHVAQSWNAYDFERFAKLLPPEEETIWRARSFPPRDLNH